MSGNTVLVAYATKKGSTREVAEAIATVLRRDGRDVDVRPAEDVDELDGYAGVVLGGSLYMGRWHRDARRFLQRHRRALATRPLAVFAMGPKTLAEDDVAGSRKQLDAALAEAPDLAPGSIAVFGGVVDPAKLRFPLNRLPASDARDWEAISAWAKEAATAFAAQRSSIPSASA
jgi:menaquinone-dependent protoporphyrinogen oxidase